MRQKVLQGTSELYREEIHRCVVVGMIMVGTFVNKTSMQFLIRFDSVRRWSGKSG